MSERRTLVAGLAEEVAPRAQERQFVYGSTAAAKQAPLPISTARTPVTTRIRDDYAKALKQVSLRRQMEGVEPNTLQDILEDAIQAWLRTNGELVGE